MSRTADTTNRILAIQSWLEKATRRWCFIVLLLLIQIVPMYTQHPLTDYSRIPDIVKEVLFNSHINLLEGVYWIFKIIPLLLIAGIFILGDRVSRWFSLYAGFNIALIAILENSAVIETYGLVILTGNMISMLLVALFWLWEVIAGVNDFTKRQRPIWDYWPLVLAFFAFWLPVSAETLRPDFNPLHLFTSAAGLIGCMMIPVYLSVLIVFFPTVNIATMRMTSMVGILFGLYNLFVDFVLNANTLWWIGVLHLPLVILSAYGLVLTFRRVTQIPAHQTQ